MIVPCFVNVVEMCLNRVLLRFRHAFVVFGFTVIYMGINLLGTLMQGSDLSEQVYPKLVVWSNPDNIWTQLLMFVTIFCAGTPALSVLFVWIHRLKSSCCAKKGRDKYEVDIKM